MPPPQIKLDDRVEALRVEYGLELSDFWELPQKRGSYCAKHSALEVIAAKAKIKFDAPQVLEAKSAEGIVSILVTGHFGDRTVWSVGECSPKNNKNSYPWAMAEKRGVDRVVLKLVGIHGLVYSEDEMSAVDTPERSSEPRVAANPVVGNIGGDRNTPASQGTRLREEDEQAGILNAQVTRALEEAAKKGLPDLAKAWTDNTANMKRLPERWELDLVAVKNKLKANIEVRQ